MPGCIILTYTYRSIYLSISLTDVEYADTPGIVTMEITGGPPCHFHFVIGIVKPIEMPGWNYLCKRSEGKEEYT